MPITSINLITLKQVIEKTGTYEIDECKITNPKECFRAVQAILDIQHDPMEKFGIITLNSQMRIVGIHIITVGGLNHTCIEPREVYQAALLNNAHAIIAFHNHPSTDPRPSIDDVAITRKLKKAGELLSVRFEDHVIVGGTGFFSMREAGVLSI